MKTWNHTQPAVCGPRPGVRSVGGPDPARRGALQHQLNGRQQ